MKLPLKSLITYFYSFLASNSDNKGFRALAYHSITNSKSDKDMWSVDRWLFQDHLSFLEENKIEVYSIETLKNKIPDDGIVITFDDGYKNNLEVAAPILSEFKMPFSVFVVVDYLKKSKTEYLDNASLKELSNNPLVSIGSHSKTHAKLKECSRKEIRSEVRDSKSYLEDLLGKEVSAFSYPHGKFNSLVKEEVMKAGYCLGFTSHYDLNRPNQDKLLLNRNEIWNSDDLNNFKRKMEGHWDWLKYRNL